MKTLLVADNALGGEGARILSDALKDDASLTHLNISSNSIGAEGAVMVSAVGKWRLQFVAGRAHTITSNNPRLPSICSAWRLIQLSHVLRWRVTAWVSAAHWCFSHVLLRLLDVTSTL